MTVARLRPSSRAERGRLSMRRNHADASRADGSPGSWRPLGFGLCAASAALVLWAGVVLAGGGA